MLVLSRKTGERVLIGEDAAVTVVRIGPNSVRLGIEAKKNVKIVREELVSPLDDVSVSGLFHDCLECVDSFDPIAMGC